MNIFVAKLDYSVTSEQLQAAFERFGRVDSARVAMDRETGNSKGFAFVEMPNDREANEAINALHESIMAGRNIVVKEASPMEDRPRGPRPGYGGSPDRGGRSSGGYGSERRGSAGGNDNSRRSEGNSGSGGHSSSRNHDNDAGDNRRSSGFGGSSTSNRSNERSQENNYNNERSRSDDSGQGNMPPEIDGDDDNGAKRGSSRGRGRDRGSQKAKGDRFSNKSNDKYSDRSSSKDRKNRYDDDDDYY